MKFSTQHPLYLAGLTCRFLKADKTYMTGREKGHIRIFDDGAYVWHMVTDWNGQRRISIAVHFSHDQYRVNLTVSMKDDARFDISGWGKTRHAAFLKLRENLRENRMGLKHLKWIKK